MADNPSAPGDRVAVVGFNDTAWIERVLTDSAPEAYAALSALGPKVADGTRLDLALAIARQAITSGSDRPGNRRVVVLLTDGLPNRVPPAEDGRPETTILRAADALKADRILVHTIGLGGAGDIDAALLRSVASGPADYHEVPDAEELAAMYRSIAASVGVCPDD
ncbi:MAG: VWA domain-containing protein [Ardenticatenales bacterium]